MSHESFSDWKNNYNGSHYNANPQERVALTLQTVADGEEVHERQVDRSPGKKGKAPGEAQEERYPRHAAYILQCGAVLQVVRVLPLDPTQLDQHHDEHDQVEEKNDTEIGHHSHVEGNVVFYPAAEKEAKG